MELNQPIITLYGEQIAGVSVIKKKIKLGNLETCINYEKFQHTLNTQDKEDRILRYI